MPDLIHDFIALHARVCPDQPALLFRQETLDYQQLQTQVAAVANGLLALGVGPGERVAVYLPKQVETVTSLFGTAAAGACFVPVNPLLKPKQVTHILQHCDVRVLVTSAARISTLAPALRDCEALRTVIVVDEAQQRPAIPLPLVSFGELCAHPPGAAPHRRIDSDMAAILYTSGSTGKPKGVVLSHRNLVAGANSVASYLDNSAADRLLAVLPLSFDAGLSQLTTAFSVGASAVLMDYLLPRDVIRAVVQYRVTGLAAVPPLWNQLCNLEWPPEAAESLRYLTNTGGTMPATTTRALRQALPDTQVYLMYGLTEAFRSTYLPPDQVDLRPESIGIAIPNADILVIDEYGNECGPSQPGELVHRGALVSLGYWNDPVQTALRFRPAPGQPPQLPHPELAVWSGDQVMKDAEGYLYFISRKDEMIKTSGYRVSPTEIEEVAHASGRVAGAAALGVPHATLGQAILLLVTADAAESDTGELEAAVLAHCRSELPNFMVPAALLRRDSLPLNQNGKIDRRALAQEYRDYFQED